jgi:uncharacterized protein
MEHLRYPEDLFKVQRYQYARYHVTDEGDFYQANDRWEVPEDPNSSGDLQPPYRLFVDTAAAAAAGEEPDPTDDASQETWSLTSTFVPFGRSNLASFVSVNSDATSPDYGSILVRELTDQNTQGPGLIANEFSNDDKVREALLPFQSGQSPPLFGNLLTLPVDDGLIYVEPVYAVRAGSTSGYPILRFVLVSYGEEVGIGETLAEAIGDALGVDPDAPPDGEPDPGDQEPGPPDEPSGTVDEQIRAQLAAADKAFEAASDALSDGDLAEYQRQVELAQTHVQNALDLAAERDGETEAPAASEGASGE